MVHVTPRCRRSLAFLFLPSSPLPYLILPPTNLVLLFKVDAKTNGTADKDAPATIAEEPEAEAAAEEADASKEGEKADADA